ncbi:hypothetical protein [Taibaiella sp. KBW10]|uniref:hypothetical protein n=1 Tax=Taibaiella sp. KBW10 TaxID=2153357 RepID=UPI000F590580|nr:hypothetical protein [Taibaiella sp. KBW10]
MKKLLTGLLLALSGTCLHAQQTQTRFQLDTVQRRITLSKELPGKGKALVQMAYKEDWQGDAEMRHLTDLAGQQLKHLQSGFKDALTQKKVYIELPEDESYVKIAFEEVQPGHKELVYKDNAYHPLKTVQDSVFILKSYGKYKQALSLSDNNDTLNRMVLYTFIVNDVAAFNDGPLRDSIAKAPSFFTAYLNDPRRQQTLRASSRDMRFMQEIDFGLTYFNDRFGMALDLGYGLLLNRYSRNSFFAMVKMGMIMNYRYPLNQSNIYLSYNLEFGSVDMSTSRGICNKYAMGFGFFQGTYSKNYTGNFQQIPNMFRMYMNFPVAAKLNLGLDIYSNFIFDNKNPKQAGMFGMYLKYNL